MWNERIPLEESRSCPSGESFFKTLKREEIYATEHVDLDDPRDHIAEFIENYYNPKRLHSALDYRSPEEFEQQAERVEALTVATVRFFDKTEGDSSTGMLRERAQTPPLPQTPSLLGESTR